MRGGGVEILHCHAAHIAISLGFELIERTNVRLRFPFAQPSWGSSAWIVVAPGEIPRPCTRSRKRARWSALMSLQEQNCKFLAFLVTGTVALGHGESHKLNTLRLRRDNDPRGIFFALDGFPWC